MRRHIEANDAPLPDADLVVKVMERYHKARGLALIDPNE
jgi:hypothetical protein